MSGPVGIIGGMGPAASEFLYKNVIEHTRAERDQEHVDMIILNDVSMPDRTEAILSGDCEPVYSRLLSDARMLSDCGCSAIAIICNTAHYFADMLEGQIDIPILHMINGTVDAIELSLKEQAGTPARVGIMATDGTIRTRLYQKAFEGRGIETWCPDADIQREVMHQIYDRVKRGLRYDRWSMERIDAAYRAAGCSHVVLGCTELSVIREQEQLPGLYIDPMQILVKRVIEFSGKCYKP